MIPSSLSLSLSHTPPVAALCGCGLVGVWRIRSIRDSVRLEISDEPSPAVLNRLTHLDPGTPHLESLSVGFVRIDTKHLKSVSNHQNSDAADALLCAKHSG
uniref:Uncharacterized protein n=1 Tax=Sinocyclocheilus anshuiensis TaxID=1608454 RepID=A0A671PUA8_9TELE